MKRDDFPAPLEGMVLTHFLTVEDQDRSRGFYADVLGGQVVLERDPCIIKLANTWVIINAGGGPTEDKPDVTLAPPIDLKNVSSFTDVSRAKAPFSSLPRVVHTLTLVRVPAPEYSASVETRSPTTKANR